MWNNSGFEKTTNVAIMDYQPIAPEGFATIHDPTHGSWNKT